jgi:hypothetical protein
MNQRNYQDIHESEACARVRAVSPAPRGRTNKYELEVTAIRGTFSIGPASLHFEDGTTIRVAILGSWNYRPARAMQDEEPSICFGVETTGPLDTCSVLYLSQRAGGQ